jgi:tetratricopeptide (TPR) repeat protein
MLAVSTNAKMIMKKFILIFHLTVFLLTGYISYCQKDSIYNIAIEKADSSYEFNWPVYIYTINSMDKYEVAKQMYLTASMINPDENYPKERIKEIDRIFNIHKSYKIKLSADTLFDNGSYKKAIVLYNKVDSLDHELSIDEKIDLCTDLMHFQNSDSAIKFLGIIKEADHYLDLYRESLMQDNKIGHIYDSDTTRFLEKAIMTYNKALIFYYKASKYVRDMLEICDGLKKEMTGIINKKYK